MGTDRYGAVDECDCDTCKAKRPKEVNAMGDVCPRCGSEFRHYGRYMGRDEGVYRCGSGFFVGETELHIQTQSCRIRELEARVLDLTQQLGISEGTRTGLEARVRELEAACDRGAQDATQWFKDHRAMELLAQGGFRVGTVKCRCCKSKGKCWAEKNKGRTFFGDTPAEAILRAAGE